MNYKVDAKALKILMLDNDFSQEDLAKEIGMSNKTICKLFSNHPIATARTINKIAKTFEVKPSSLVIEDD